MDLQIAVMVAFAIYTEADTGIMGVDPTILRYKFADLDRCETVAQVLEALPIDLHWKWDNYWSIWSADLEEPAPSPEDDQVEITEKGELALEDAGGSALPRTITLTEKGEAAAQAAELEIQAEAEAAQQPVNKPPAGRRAPRKGH